ncbi:hypothetical protein ELUMI_v1c00800 [Williamsoniiplasma luminosum]|uniref:BspA family leucine-rich repeat surface protein n=4 Tax=Williamsoniiplasma luminosum TaxID=214888 RepID=A0A2K8NUG5_9MOLU|nr:BspA family leucine-rich repeat surface protein [Williamsoniiplasma luminosum]ATZ16808.1 hypothetical protein ELUMI_v1c00800 [Williamsoniiplasma luminosum]
MKKLLSILGTLGLASTSTTMVVSWTMTPRTNDLQVITKDSLTQLIADANALAIKEKSKPSVAYQTLHQAIGQAKGVLDIYLNETENHGVLSEAYEALQTAMKTFENTNDELAHITTLKTRTTDANSLLNKHPDKTEAEKNRLKAVISEAEALSKKNPPKNDQNLVDKALLKLQTAMVSFLNSTNTSADYSKLNTAITEANKALKDHPKKAEGVKNSLRKAIKHAQEVIDKQYTTSDQLLVDQEVTHLKDAIQKFLDAGKERANTDKLEAIIVDYRNISQWHKSDQAWLVFQQAIEHAQGVVDGQPTLDKQQVVDQEVEDIQKAESDFINSQDQKADLQWLNSNIAMARTIKIMNKKQSDWDVFQSAIVKAENYVKNPPTIDKQDEVDKEAEDLWQATYQFLNAVNHKDISSTIFWKTSIGALSDNKPATIKKRLEEKYTLKEGKDYNIGEVKDYNGRFGVELIGINDYTKTTVVTFVLEIKNIEYDLFDLVNSKQNQLWTADELQTAIEGKNLDIENALKVTEVAHEQALQVKRFKITANDQYDYSNYKGEIIVNQVLNRENQTKTIYIDPADDTIKSKDYRAPEGVKEIINLGWDGIKIHRTPTTIEKVPDFISPNIESLERLFEGATKFNQDISKWETQNIVNMASMFRYADAFNQNLKTNGNQWNTSNVTNMIAMFSGALTFNKNISNWNTVKLTNMGDMFQRAKAFNQDLSKWNMQNVIDYKGFDNEAIAWQDEYKPKFN